MIMYPHCIVVFHCCYVFWWASMTPVPADPANTPPPVEDQEFQVLVDVVATGKNL